MHYSEYDNEMNAYPNVLTPPSDSPESLYLLSPTSCTSPPQTFAPQGNVLSYILNGNQIHTMSGPTQMPHLKIIEQPMDKFRFRYKSEMAGTHGSLNGINSDRSRKQTYPTVQLMNFDQPALIRCSLYQVHSKKSANETQPHAHRLIKKQGAEEIDDPHNVQVSASEGYVAVFHSMGIIHTAKKNIVTELKRKKELLEHERVARSEGKRRSLNRKEINEINMTAESESKSINLNIVCLRFDAFVVTKDVLQPICAPVYSHPINNLKSALTGDLKIVRMDHCSSPSRGGREIFILVEKVTKKNIKIRFYETDDEDNEIWSDFGKFSDLDVHHQYAIVFKTPAYKQLDIDNPVSVFLELLRPSDGARSDSKEFKYTPSETRIGGKRARSSFSSYSSSNYPSDELPATISNIYIGGNENMFNDPQSHFKVTSADLEEALRAVGSDEFERIFCSELGLKYQNLAVDAPPVSLIRRDIKESDRELIKRIQDDLFSFLKTKPTEKRVQLKLEHVFNEKVASNGNNALHIAVSDNMQKFATLLIKSLIKYKQGSYIDQQNNNKETALHIAVQCNNTYMVEQLLIAKADVSITDLDGNSSLHLAIKHNVLPPVFKMLLLPPNLREFINLNNNDGHTALHLAVRNCKLQFVQLLCQRGADVNKHQLTDGFTPLHIAINERHLLIVKYLLSSSDIDALKSDFNGCSPSVLATALIKDAYPDTLIISKQIEDHLKDNNIFEESTPAQPDDETSNDEPDSIEIKSEPLSPQATRTLYAEINDFTLECLEKLAAQLDKTGSWQNLADLLDYGHLIRSNVFKNPSKNLLTYAIRNGDSVLQIRDFLEHLDEVEAVKIIDDMVGHCY